MQYISNGPRRTIYEMKRGQTNYISEKQESIYFFACKPTLILLKNRYILRTSLIGWEEQTTIYEMKKQETNARKLVAANNIIQFHCSSPSVKENSGLAAQLIHMLVLLSGGSSDHGIYSVDSCLCLCLLSRSICDGSCCLEV